MSAGTEIYTPAVQAAYFPYLLWNVVENDFHWSIWWSADGAAIVVHKKMFISDIFGTSGIKDFYRQLDLYGFKTATFVHENDRHPSGLAIAAEQVMIRQHIIAFTQSCGKLNYFA